jgi:cytochrome c6
MNAMRCIAAAIVGAACLMPLLSHAVDQQIELGKRLFTQGAEPACIVCHTLKDAQAEGTIGPVLDELKPDAQRVATALRNGLGNMPSYKNSLSDEQILALARYVEAVAGRSP